MMASIEAPHQHGVCDENEHETGNRALLGHPEAERSMADLEEMSIAPIPKEDATAKADDEPHGE